MVRALDYEWDAQTRGVEVQASAVHFSFLEFFSKRLMSFIISIIIAILLQISFIIFDYRIRPFTHDKFGYSRMAPQSTQKIHKSQNIDLREYLNDLI